MCLINSSTPANTNSSSTTAIDDNASSFIPTDSLSKAAYSYVKSRLQPELLAHSLRVFFYARQLSYRPSPSDDFIHEPIWHSQEHLPLLFTACMFHDYGACSAWDDGPWRFEVEGADAALAFLKAHGVVDRSLTHAVWTAIACHTTPHVAERMSAITRLLRLGPLCDFHRLSTGSVQVIDRIDESDGKRIFIFAKDVRQIESLFPRGQIERVLSDNVVTQARQPGMAGKAPEASWPGGLVAFADANPAWEGLTKAF